MQSPGKEIISWLLQLWPSWFSLPHEASVFADPWRECFQGEEKIWSRVIKKKDKRSPGLGLGVSYKHVSSVLSCVQSSIAVREKETLRSSASMSWFFSHCRGKTGCARLSGANSNIRMTLSRSNRIPNSPVPRETTASA